MPRLSFTCLCIFCSYVWLLSAPAPPLRAAELGTWNGARVSVSGDFIGGYFHDYALLGSAGRETQSFKMSRGIIGLDIQHESGFGGLLEYNIFPDDTRREGDETSVNYDWYKNLGTDLYFYGDFNARNAYLRYISPKERWLLRFGRMVNIIGFEEGEVPFWGRVDSPHAHFLTKGIFNGVSTTFQHPWIRIEAAVLSGRDRPDSDYNWYLKGAADPNINDNTHLKLEGEATLRWREVFALSVGYHTGKNGSAPGSIYNGKHNDDRLVYGFKGRTQAMGPFALRLIALGQYSDFTVGLTEDGAQGEATPNESQDLEKTGWFVTGGFSLFERVQFYVTHEEIDRIDSKVWFDIAGCDITHSALESVERSTIIHAEIGLARWVSLYGFYRFLDYDFGKEASGIYEPVALRRDYDRYGAVLRVRF